MSASLSNSPERPRDGDSSTLRVSEAVDTPRYAVLAQAHWPGLEILLCHEDIRQPTCWAIQQSRHTVIIHLSGSMRTLDTEIDGVGATHKPPAPGDIWLIPAEWRYASQARGRFISYVELRVAPDAHVEAPQPGPTVLDNIAPRLGHRDEFLYYAMSRLCTLIRQTDDLSVMMAERLQLLLRQHLFRDYRSPGPGTSAGASPAALSPMEARAIGDYVEAHLDQRITLQDLAHLAGKSVHQLLIAFRRNFGTTPAQYVLAQRLRRARWQLLNTADSIAEIALACGFSSHSHLSAAFKRESGITPREFRDGLRTRQAP